MTVQPGRVATETSGAHHVLGSWPRRSHARTPDTTMLEAVTKPCVDEKGSRCSQALVGLVTGAIADV
jgi:hypothetical protein